jgi:hypothetical protein
MHFRQWRRREFITLLGGVAASLFLPLLARGQQPVPTVIGFLNSQSPERYAEPLRGLRQGLRETGYIEGENLTIDYRWANNQIERLPALPRPAPSRHRLHMSSHYCRDVGLIVSTLQKMRYRQNLQGTVNR